MGLGIVVLVNDTPDPQLAEATAVEVHEQMGEATTFSLKYPVTISGGDIPLLADSRLDAETELAILAGTGESIRSLQSLVRGPVLGHQVRLVHGGGNCWLEVRGSDTSVRMDRESKTLQWSDVADSDAATNILQRYYDTLDIEPTASGHYEAKHTLLQDESDLHFVRRLARRNGFLFWVTGEAFGPETAHFRPPPLGGATEAEISINLDAPKIVALDISWDTERPTKIECNQLNQSDKSSMSMAVSGPVLPELADKPISVILRDMPSVILSAPVDDAGDLGSRGRGALVEAELFVRANCETTLATMGKLVRAHTVVEVKGAGTRYSGKYFVAGVRHIIDAEKHRMNIELVRNGWNGGPEAEVPSIQRQISKL